MSLFTKIRDIATAPLKSTIKADPLLNRLTTGKFTGGFKGFRERTAGGVHELYKVDKLAQRLGVKEKHVTNVAMVVGVVIATYFTAGAASGAFGGAAGATAGTAAGAGTGITAGGAYTTAQALYSLQQAKQAKEKQQAEQKAAEQMAREAEQQLTTAPVKPSAVDTKTALGYGALILAAIAVLA